VVGPTVAARENANCGDYFFHPPRFIPSFLLSLGIPFLKAWWSALRQFALYLSLHLPDRLKRKRSHVYMNSKARMCCLKLSTRIRDRSLFVLNPHRDIVPPLSLLHLLILFSFALYVFLIVLSPYPWTPVFLTYQKS